ncbi:MAG: hypothetical protein HONBIEJF_00135 [Fimbriimonadaceae bacterium]|nr:hypothetical protein [Fimbriimonadaceae bacterium]
MTEPILVVLGLLAFVALAVVAIIASNRAAEAQRVRLAAFAAERGLNYAPYGLSSEPPGCLTFSWSQNYDVQAQYLENFLGFEPFGKGTSQTVRNRISGEWQGLEWEIFDYSYTISSGKSSTTYRYAIVAAQFGFVVPDIDIRRENVFDRIGSWVGIRDMQFESIEFNGAFHVKSQDEKRAYDLIHPGAIDYLMACEIREWQLAGRTIVLIQNDTLSIPLIDRMMGAIVEFLALVPDYYRDDNSIRRA